MNRLDIEDRCRIIAALVQGNGIRSTVRMTGVAKNTIQKLLIDLGTASLEFQDRTMRNLSCRRIQVDECWAFCYAKSKNGTPEIAAKVPCAGDIWTWAAIDADTKLIPSWIVGPRDGMTARIFVNDLASRLASGVQLTNDGLSVYLAAVERAFRGHGDYAQLQKIYGNPPEPDTPHSPGECIGCELKIVGGYPDPAHVSISYIERANLTIRMGMRRFPRPMNAFSKKIENHRAAIALHMMYYNFVRIHTTLRCTPAMAARVTDRLWEISDIVALFG